MAAEQQIVKFKKYLRILLLVLPTLGAATWSVQPALNSYLTTLTLNFPTMPSDEWTQEGTAEKLRRKMQIHFLENKIYVPMEDIVINNKIGEDEEKRLFLLMDKSCGHAKVYVWLPLKFRIPFTGDKLVEWCWKPTVNISKKSESG